jgi:ribonuclease P protein subunit RPR2
MVPNINPNLNQITDKNKTCNRKRSSRSSAKTRRTKAMLRIANERIALLFGLADQEALRHNLSRANRYVELGRKIGMRYNVRLKSEYQRKFCKYCYSYLLHGYNARARLSGSKLTVLCMNCGRYNRFPYLREKRTRTR